MSLIIIILSSTYPGRQNTVLLYVVLTGTYVIVYATKYQQYIVDTEILVHKPHLISVSDR